MSAPETKLFSKIHVHVNSKRADEVAFKNLSNKIEMLIMEFDADKKHRAEVKTISLDIKSAKRLRAMLDVHIKMFET